MLQLIDCTGSAPEKTRAAVAALLKLCAEGSTAELARPALFVPQQAGVPAAASGFVPAIVALKVPGYSLGKLTKLKHQLAESMAGASFTSVSCDRNACITCSWEGQQMQVLLCATTPISVLQLLDPSPSSSDREALACCAVAARTAFLQQQPALYKTAAHVAYLWAVRHLGSTKESGVFAKPCR